MRSKCVDPFFTCNVPLSDISVCILYEQRMCSALWHMPQLQVSIAYHAKYVILLRGKRAKMGKMGESPLVNPSQIASYRYRRCCEK